MKNKIKYAKGPFGKQRVVEDFLPAPENLIFKEATTKVTLNLSDHSLEFFKDAAKRNNASYQRMIRNLLDIYVQRQMANRP
ncbi:MAG: CopG family transcriptional regulator [Candidatus Marinimicrobia bacterium]|nr:CopG family transcriptional regulator [Candidatus Neomarinimicrobiota bacterium]